MSNTQRNKMMKSFSFHRYFNGGQSGASSLWRIEGSELRKWFALGTDIYTNLWWLGQESTAKALGAATQLNLSKPYNYL